ncbi:glycoside hydrolase family 27 protein [Lutibacter citreus]|uniref:glycoside hydrolase family 27 protein n=1 Tax=Lutibacter citreus TaxID=2138210 RepID=UPI000DBE3606|nr:glycoside hydrolase family 27 protein [Lutibacter citreus]
MKKLLNKEIVLIVLFLVFTNIGFSQESRSIAPTPPMGWNSWNTFGKKKVNEQNMREAMDAMVLSGLRDAGYNYFVIDGGWRDAKLDNSGRLLAHPTKFPNGMKALADYAHSKGLKFGLHTVPGTHDCGGDPVGGMHNEEIQIKQFADWGVDFIKLDRCKFCGECKKGEGWTEESIEKTYKKWANLLAKSRRKILLSISAYEFRNWNPEVCSMSRTTGDIASLNGKETAVFIETKDKNPHFFTVMECAELNNKSAKYAGNGYWNDPDMLVTGDIGLTPIEEISHFALWNIMSAPLMLGNDPRKMKKSELDLLLNKEMIAVNQDNLEQGYIVKEENGCQIWRKTMSDGSLVFLLLNLNEEQTSIKLNFSEFKLDRKMKFRNLVEHKNEGSFKRKYSKKLLPHECVFLRTILK